MKYWEDVKNWELTKLMQHEILIYAQPPASIGSLRLSLAQSFNNSDIIIRSVTAADIRRGALRGAQPKIFILPGITGEVSEYTNQLDSLALAEIRDFVTRGNAMMTICAGSYFVSRETVYVPPWDQPKGKKSISPLFNGVAKGPIPEYARQPSTESRTRDVTVIPLKWKDEKGNWQDAGVCYGNGPELIPDNQNDPNMEVLARFKDIAGEPIAMLRQKIGKGFVYMSSVLPEIGYQQLRPVYGIEPARNLMSDLQPHEPGRKKLWDSLIARIRSDLALH